MELDYINNFRKNASMLDALTVQDTTITEKVLNIIQTQDSQTTADLLRQLSGIASEYSDDNRVRDVLRAFYESLIDYYGYCTIRERFPSQKDIKPEISKETEPQIHPVTEEKSLQELIDELNQLVGLDSVKSKVNDLIAFHQIQKLRETNGLITSNNTLHLAFTGNPGTGKTTVARIVGRIYKQIGLLSKGHFMEVSRTDLIAGYQGQTALKVKNVIEQAKGGVLFIDEAYSLTENDHTDSYGRECLTELTKALEDYRDDLVVIVAGYTKPMKVFFESNPGLKSRFNTFIEFGDYSLEELLAIMLNLCEKNDYSLCDDAKLRIKKALEYHILQDGEPFSNGRLVRNMFEDIITNQAKRLVKSVGVGIDELRSIIGDDVPIILEGGG